MVRNALDMYMLSASDAHEAAQELIAANSPTSDVPAATSGNRAWKAGWFTVTLVIFLTAMLWGLGQLTGESLYKRAAEAAS